MAMAHEHHAVHPSDLDVLDAVSSGNMPQHVVDAGSPTHFRSSRRSSASSQASSQHAALNGRRGGGAMGPEQHAVPQRRRPLDTLQALRRPPIDPIVLAASLSSGPHITRHHFLHSFGPKQESKQMPRSDRIRIEQEEEAKAQRSEDEAARQQQASSSSRNDRTPSPQRFSRPRAGSYANCDADDVAAQLLGELATIDESSAYRSTQMPRSQRLQRERTIEEKRAELRREKEMQKAQRQLEEVQHARQERPKPSRVKQVKEDDAKRPNLPRLPSAQLDEELMERKAAIQNANSKAASAAHTPDPSAQPSSSIVPLATSSMASIVRPPPLNVRCYARTRIPTPHGEIFCHLYRNNRDGKEHLALVIDPEQNSPQTTSALEKGQDVQLDNFIRSRTLNEVWGPSETEMERIVRGAYVGRLSSTSQMASTPTNRRKGDPPAPRPAEQQAPLVRIHSECYTGETIGSQRCDCGEQLDEAIRLIHADAEPAKGVVVYLRQEGRGIGLLDKLMAYNLQDMGHDTVSANILLGHLADARKYDIAAEILRDLGMHECRLLTNNPEKIDALEAEGVRVVKRVAMVPRIWRLEDASKRRRHRHRHRAPRARTSNKSAKSRIKPSIHGLESSIISQPDDGVHTADTGSPALGDNDGASEYSSNDDSDASHDSFSEHVQRRAGATMVGASVTRGPELEKYLRTKVERMGHLLDVPPEEQERKEREVEKQRNASRPSKPPLEHLADDDGSIPRSVEPDADDEAVQAATDDDVEPGSAVGSIAMSATDSAPGTASEVGSIASAADDQAPSGLVAASRTTDDEGDDDQILIDRPQ